MNALKNSELRNVGEIIVRAFYKKTKSTDQFSKNANLSFI
jgi:hypothetical protein